MSLGVPLLIGVSVACVGAGAFVTYFAFVAPARARTSRADERCAEAEEALERERSEREALVVGKATSDAAAQRVPLLEKKIDDLGKTLETTGQNLVEAQTSLTAERKSHAARVDELKKMGAEIEKNFKALAADVLGKNSESFLKLVSERFEKHKTSADKDLEKRRIEIQTLVKPIGENLAKLKHEIGEIEKAREGAYRTVTEQVKNLVQGQTDLRSETGRLVQALRQPKTRGRWGEYQLRNVLEMAGMTEHVDFVEQKAVGGEDGRLRPDVIVYLPGGKSIIVDAKTPLEGYLAAVEADNEEDRKRHMDAHARHVRDHIRALSSKEYWKELPATPDFVVMFVPGEAFFAAAIESDPALFERAVKERVLISTPTTFIALVKAIAYGWQQQKLAENTQAVAVLARELYKRIKTFGGHMGGLGASLHKAVKQYNEGVGSLETRVLPTARKFETLGVVSADATLPEIAPVEIEARELHAPELTDYNREDGEAAVRADG